ncbi:MAG TPA: nitroreductase family deazaflavin-dependent oxidoreductase [Deltaproteobacteria bacterium]|nr:nitroreductase family deazaflavin-dependent oxidoreductase [Deltaproteobacteria bacterium]
METPRDPESRLEPTDWIGCIDLLEFAVPHSRKPRGLTLRLYRLPIALYRLGLGGLLGSRFLLLEHRGRRSGQTRYAVLEVVRRDAATGAYIVGSGFGEGSEWFLNLMADPHCHLQIGRRRFAVTARRLAQEESKRELLDYVRRHPRAAHAVVRIIGLDLNPSTPAGIDAFARAVPLLALERSSS